MEPKRQSQLALAGFVHDLNNVFETIQDAAELISDDEEWSEVAAAVLRSVERGRRLVGGFAGLTQPECEVSLVVEQAADFLEDLLKMLPVPRVTVTSRVPERLRLVGAASDWERVFMNLFLNAAQAMKDGGEIEVAAKRLEGRAEIRVLDSGSGIPVENLPRIFEPHFSTRSADGGLGLHIVDSIVRQQGGTVRAMNRDERSGACFLIDAPLAG
jgi:signal transduction histidine kinase